MDQEMLAFQNDLLKSVRQMNTNQAVCITEVTLSLTAAVRCSCDLSQMQFAELLGVSVHRLQDWEEGHSEPVGAAKTLLKILERHPDVLRELAA
ncbi:DNA-binding transcriptional regulator [Chromatium okenii]|uniref:helix-turn-helix domain-containing protein n=1 Tax=Chromatium okenii TaxID=61644 RepID=UPI0026F2092C|nr:type II toxin-antitoxin system MqsA family antitoxin [Chromatium okenii]MBV5308082.1 type II toxin-antitoxin system MqsA family antitoxin [Chromatium okenii]